jgi:hypothetical protein
MNLGGENLSQYAHLDNSGLDEESCKVYDLVFMDSHERSYKDI